MTLGSVLIDASALLGALSLVTAIGWARGRTGWERVFRVAYFAMTASLAAASIVLLRAILTHDFRYDYVIGYTSRDLPGLYLFSAFWGGQEGTYLLWALFGALLGLPLFRKGSWQPASVMIGYTFTVGILIAFMLDPGGNPFRLASHVPPDGRGLNPLLQDPWMATHPPVVFLGYAVMTIPAVLAWVAAWRNEDREWVLPALRWSLIGFVTLGTGIILGAVWAYKVLGWGGFWGWDPVENASLIPWVVGAALIHGLLVQHTTGALRRTNLTLAMAGYVLVLYATFLTRSGVLADFSVHSFPKGTIYGLLVTALVLVVAISIVAQMRRRMKEGPPMEGRFAWPFVLSATIVLFSISALLVLIGTSWPIVSSLVGKPATPTGGFYNQVNLPVYTILLAVLALGPFLSWVPLPTRLWFRRFLPSLAFGIAGTVAAAILGGRGLSSLALFFVALLALGSNLIRIAELARRRPWHIGAAVTHTGFALLFVGIVASESWDRSEHLRLPFGQPVQAFGRVLTYGGHVDGSEPKHEWRLSVSKADASGHAVGRATAALVTMYRNEENQIFRKPAILRGIPGDLYLAPSDLEQPESDQPDRSLTGESSGGRSGTGQGEDGVTSGGTLLTLYKNKPISHEGAVLTFLRFEMGGTMGEGMLVNAVVQVSRDAKSETLTLPLRAGEGGMEGTPVEAGLLDGVRLTFRRMSVEEGSIQVEAAGGQGQAQSGQAQSGQTQSGQTQSGKAQAEATPAEPEQAGETLIVDASMKPLINLLWLGTFLLVAGTTIAFLRRIMERKAVALRDADAPRVAAARSARPRP